MRRGGQVVTSAARRRERGATMTEYAIILFIVAIVGATAVRLFGSKLQGNVGTAGGALSSASDPPRQGSGGGGGPESFGGATATTSHGANGGRGAQEGFGGARAPTTATAETSYAKFALVALGILGAAAAFFAALKGKHAR